MFRKWSLLICKMLSPKDEHVNNLTFSRVIEKQFHCSRSAAQPLRFLKFTSLLFLTASISWTLYKVLKDIQ